MPIRSCRGKDKKEEIYRLYDLEIGPYCKIPRHQRTQNNRNECCGTPLTDEFVQFFYSRRRASGANNRGSAHEDNGSFFVGRTCADQFVELMRKDNKDIQLPPVFDPLRHPPRRGGKSGGAGLGIERKRPSEPTPLNQEVMTVLQILATICTEPLTAKLNDALKWLREHPERDTEDWCVTNVNDAVGLHPEMIGRSLRAAMNEEEALGKEEWREFTFENIERVLRADGLKSHIDPQAVLSDQRPLTQTASVVRTVKGGVRVRPDGTHTEVVLFDSRLEKAGIQRLNIGDLVRVRLGMYPEGPRVMKVYEVIERGVSGRIRYIHGPGNYGLLKRDDVGDAFIPPNILKELHYPVIGTRLAVRVAPGEQGDRVTWAVRLRE